MTASETGQKVPELRATLERFTAWLDGYGETSQDHQDFFASKVGRASKAFYYRHRRVGQLAVAPMIFCEAFAPWTRRFFFPRTRLPIADAHFAMGFAYLYQTSDDPRRLERAEHFLEVLEQTRCPDWERRGWGYPFDWQTQGGVLARGTPLITTNPYCYEAYAAVYHLNGREQWREAMRSAVDHALLDYRDVPAGPDAATCTYTPAGGERVVNASAYRAGMLLHAHAEFDDDRYRRPAEQNVNFVLQCQQPDGSWPYAVDGKRPFVDHFHTCFVMKGLAKVERLTGHAGCTRALERGVAYYVENLFDADGLPKPFAQAPRMTVYRRELYDCAECLNLGSLLRGRFPTLDAAVDRTLDDILSHWVQPQGCFRGRKLHVGWDNVPMHRWGQSEMFRSLALLLAQRTGKADPAAPVPVGSRS